MHIRRNISGFSLLSDEWGVSITLNVNRKYSAHQPPAQFSLKSYINLLGQANSDLQAKEEILIIKTITQNTFDICTACHC